MTECSALDSTIETLSVDRWRAFTRMSFNREARDFAVVRQRARIVAILTSTLLATTDRPVRHFRIIVHPDERRRGIGTLLLELVGRQDCGRDVEVQCNCLASWGAGREFLRQSSFRVARRYLDMVLRDTPNLSSALPARCVIRPYQGTDLDVANWLRLDHEGYSDDPDAQRPTAVDLEVRRSQRGFRMWLMECDGATVGFLHATEGARTRIHSLVVASGWRGRGFARALMIHAIHALRRDGAIAFTLGVRAENATALRLYQGLGFEVVEETETWQRAAPGA
ncbi:MAG TPA: GNAT family N-acetyltransferase [Gemmatimonadota bacterium]|nr:GNAT family N-acetyltransferase [Gemmatimonadota bacterium]